MAYIPCKKCEIDHHHSKFYAMQYTSDPHFMWCEDCREEDNKKKEEKKGGECHD